MTHPTDNSFSYERARGIQLILRIIRENENITGVGDGGYPRLTEGN